MICFALVVLYCSPSMLNTEKWNSCELPSTQVQCPGQTTLQGTMTPGARCTLLRVVITHRPLRTASLHMVVPNQASPLLPTQWVQTPRCTQASQGAILLARTQDSLTLVGIQELATPVPLPCPLSSHLPYHQMSWALVRRVSSHGISFFKWMLHQSI